MAILIVVVLGFTTASRTAIWQDEEQLWAESDEDPACMTDPYFPAAQAHLFRFEATIDPKMRWESIKRAIDSRGARHPHFGDACYLLAHGALAGIQQENLALATRWALGAATICPSKFEGWDALMFVSLHRNPATAAIAAERAQRLAPWARHELFAKLTKLELTCDEDAATRVAKLTQSDPKFLCPVVATWKAGASHEVQSLEEAFEWCICSPRDETCLNPPPN